MEQNRTSTTHRLMQVEPGEIGTLVRCGLCFFFVLFGYFLLRPIREAMGVERSMNDLRWLFVVTCVSSLILMSAFGGLVSRLDGRRFIPVAFRMLIACLGAFIVARMILGDQGRLYTGYVFYVWLSVVNLFVMSLFWAFMADTWTLEQGKRLFAIIGVGGTLGALLGSNFVWWLSKEINPMIQMVIAALMFEIASRLVRSVHQRTINRQRARPHESCSTVGGRWFDGLVSVGRSPYLLGIGMYIVMLAISNTLIYFTQAKLVVNASDELSTRIALFAQLDMWTQLATLLVQLFVTAHLIKRIGVGWTLALLPIVTLVGFGALAWVSAIDGVEGWQIFGVFAAFNAIHRATRYAMIRPARETLFSVVSAQDKYKAKPIVDVFLYRGGDVAGAGAEQAIAVAGIAIGSMVMMVAPLAVVWGGLSIVLALAQHRKAISNEHRDPNQRTRVQTQSTPTTTAGPIVSPILEQ